MGYWMCCGFFASDWSVALRVALRCVVLRVALCCAFQRLAFLRLSETDAEEIYDHLYV